MRDAAARQELPDPGERGVERYSTRAFPAYRYVPGHQPHPTRDPRGHSYQASSRLAHHRAWTAEEWAALEAWLYGVDLFNHFYFWEAHEAWESLWATARPETAPALLLQGLIQITAALLKVHSGVVGGAQSLAVAGLAKLARAVETNPTLLGLDVLRTRRELAAYLAPLGGASLPVLDRTVPVLRLEAL